MKYKRGRENKVADTLSRKEEVLIDPTLAAISYPTATWLEDLKLSYQDDATRELLSKLNQGALDLVKYNYRNDILFYKGRLYVGSTTALREQLVKHAHDSPIGGHSSYDRHYTKQHIRQYIRECHTCQQAKHENLAPEGLLQPLPIPDRVWSHIIMDFIEGLLISHGYSILYMVVDQLSKYAHFILLSHAYIASKVAMAFMHSVFKLHGLPDSIISDRDLMFTSTFWKEFFKTKGTTLFCRTTYHPQTDG